MECLHTAGPSFLGTILVSSNQITSVHTPNPTETAELELPDLEAAPWTTAFQETPPKLAGFQPPFTSASNIPVIRKVPKKTALLTF